MTDNLKQVKAFQGRMLKPWRWIALANPTAGYIRLDKPPRRLRINLGVPRPTLGLDTLVPFF
jgi:hypothetical protein